MGLGMVLGGALAGYGKGVTDLATSREDERRQAALENLRSQNSQKETEHRAGQEDWLDSRSNARRTDSRLVEIGVTAEVEKDRDVRQRGWQVEDREDSQSHAQRMAVVNSNLDIATLRTKRAMEAGDIADSVVDKNGEIVFITKGGDQIRSGLVEPAKPSSSSDGSILGEVRQQQQGGLGGARPQPAAQKPAPKPAQSTQPRKPENKVYRATTDAEADRFVNNPANKGKAFVAPDGKRYVVQ